MTCAQIISELAIAAGSRQLIAGQVADLEGEGKSCTLARSSDTSTRTRPPR